MGFGSKDKDINNDKHTDEATVNAAIEKAGTILQLIEDDIDEKTKTGNCADFFESVIEGVTGIRSMIEERRSVSDKQIRSLDNWEEAVRKFIH